MCPLFCPIVSLLLVVCLPRLSLLVSFSCFHSIYSFYISLFPCFSSHSRCMSLFHSLIPFLSLYLSCFLTAPLSVTQETGGHETIKPGYPASLPPSPPHPTAPSNPGTDLLMRDSWVNSFISLRHCVFILLMRCR